MGCYDSVNIPCPTCGEMVEFQSKAGDRCLDTYEYSSVPVEIAIDLDGASSWCKCCGTRFSVHVSEKPKTVSMVSLVD